MKTPLDLRIAPMIAADWPVVSAIYGEGIASGNATFETRAPAWADWDACHLSVARLVLWAEDWVVGWAALAPVSTRAVYRGVAEVSIYVASEAQGQGAGKALLRALVEAAERAGIWTLQAGIFPENEASLAVHRACGFRVVGRRERIGQQENRWRDVILMERRSTVVG